MKRHWQREPLLVRQAWPGIEPPASRRELMALCAQDDVESRCVERLADRWRLRHGPFRRSSLPPLSRPGWTLLVQGLDLHLDAAHRILRAFDFIAQARLDDLMLSYASDGGGVGPHVDSYDVFLLQVHGSRRWRVAPPGRDEFIPGLPLRVLSRFEPRMQWTLEPGDLLYLPPGWGHDGTAVGGDCMTASVGFRAPTAAELAGAVLQGLVEEISQAAEDSPSGPWARRLRDPGVSPTRQGGRIPVGLERFAGQVRQRICKDSVLWARALGIWLTEPNPLVWFGPGSGTWEPGQGIQADRRTRMGYDDRHVFVNGEAFRVTAADARLLGELCDHRELRAASCRHLSPSARDILAQWVRQGWMHPHTGRP